MRGSRVRTAFLLSLVALVVACTDGGPKPEPQSGAVGEAKPSVEPQPGQPNTSAQPKEVAPEVTPDSQAQPEEVAPIVTPVEVAPSVTPPYDGPPRLELVAQKVSDEDTLELCPYKVEPHGFPAISEDGATVLGAYVWFDGRDQFKNYLELTWVDAITTRVEQVYAHEEAQEAAEKAAEAEQAPWNEEAEFKRVCKESEARTRKQVEQLNAELLARKWRGLEVLDALYTKPGDAQAIEQFGFMSSEGATTYIDEVIPKLATADRPIEVYYHAGHFIGRVRGTKVLQDIVLPDYRQHENEFCDTVPNIAAIYFDRATKVALMKYNHHEEGCLCDEHSYFARIELSPELLAEADLRKTTKFRSAYATYMVVLENE